MTLRHLTIALLAVALAACWLGPVRAQDGDDDGGRKVDLHFEDRPITEVLDWIRAHTGLGIVLDESSRDIRVRILGLRDISGTAAVKIVAEEAGLEVSQDEVTGIWRLSPPRVTFSFNNAALDSVINAIALSADVDIFISPDVEGTITITLTDKPWRQALDIVARQSGYYVIEDDGIFSVVTREQMQDDLTTEVIPLKFQRANERYRAMVDDDELGDLAVTTPRAPDPDGEAAGFTLLEMLRQVATPGLGYVELDAGRNAVIVRDTKPSIEAMRRIVAELDRRPGQVHIQIRVVRTRNDDLFDFGVDWTGTAGGNDNVPNIIQTFGSTASALPFSIDRDWGGLLDRISLSGAGPTGTDRNTNLAGQANNGFTFGSLDFSAVSASLEFMDSKEDTNVVQAPSILTTSGDPATIFVGRQVPYAELSSEASDSGGVSVTLQEGNRSPAQEGFQLWVLPRIVPGTEKVVLQVIPRFSAVTLQNFSSGGAGAATNIDLPRVDQTTLVTELSLHNGRTLFIGGLIDDTVTVDERKVPFLGDIPGLSLLTKNTTETAVREATMIYITVRIVRDPVEAAQLLAQIRREREERNRQAFDLLREGEDDGADDLEDDIEEDPAGAGEEDDR